MKERRNYREKSKKGRNYGEKRKEKGRKEVSKDISNEAIFFEIQFFFFSLLAKEGRKDRIL